MYPIDFFFRAAEQYPDRIALDGPEGRITYARLAADTRALATASGQQTKSEKHGYGQNEFVPWQVGAVM